MMLNNTSFDDHEFVRFVRDLSSGPAVIMAIRSTVLGPAMSGSRPWRYLSEAEGLTDALCLSRGMSYKNALAGKPIEARIVAGSAAISSWKTPTVSGS